ncbi:hypothetical protein [Pedobacter sp. MC2016-24]|uniref:hypothetical protein n=1 Tax=Pedobacter sp. MC2016-24 TaxID=2780090 RepID=UPI001881B769|nr:hypothetical protein [Pedobacter sp. MC2016-24]MBE9597671.1 hypothetical protein [Pedobacter sp. MC2016-24]
MAKEIKAIKCPQCGSTDKTELRIDFYRCNNCQTEYFLDDNDVTINYNHNYNHNRPNYTTNNNRAIKVIGIFAGVAFALVIVINTLTVIFGSKRSSNTAAVYSAGVTEREEDQGYSSSRYQNFSFLQTSTQQPVVMFMENRRYRSNVNKDKEGTYLAFYNPLTKKLLAEEKISDKSLSSSDFKIRTFSDGNTYAINDKSSLLMLDKENFKMVEAGKRFFNAKQELQVGVATMEFVYEDNGDGLILLTNDGKKRFYYPLVQKLYDEDAYYNAQIGFNTLLPGAKDKTYFVFTSTSSDYPEEKLQLLQINYKDNGGGPKDIAENISWGKDYGGSGIFTDRDPYTKVLLSNYSKQRGRINSWKDLTPGRLYFSPAVAFDDGNTLIIRFKADANPKSSYKLQQINRNTGAVEWTSEIPGGERVNALTKFKSGYVGTLSSDEMVLLDFKGQVTGNYKLD